LKRKLSSANAQTELIVPMKGLATKGSALFLALLLAVILCYPTMSAHAVEGDSYGGEYSLAGDDVNLPPENWDTADEDAIITEKPSVSLRVYYEQYYFDFQKGQVHRCGPAHKGDFNGYGHVDAQNGYIYFVAGSKFRAWLCTSDNAQISQSVLVTQIGPSYKIPYYSGKIPAKFASIYLRAHVDPKSTTQWVRIWGYYQP
jgi:hypothetical protein